MLLEKLASYVVRRKLEKSGQLEELEKMFKARAASRYNDFEDLWNDISLPLNDDPHKQKQFFFTFQFLMFSTIWNSLTREQAEQVKLIAMNFYGLPMSAIKKRIESQRNELPEILLAEEKKHLVPDYIELLSDTHTEFEDASDSTFDEAITVMPEDLKYPEESALRILENMGYTREKVTKLFPISS